MAARTVDLCRGPLYIRPVTFQTGLHTLERADVCMRFGCGARIPPTVPGDMCEVCARAGFIRPPPAPPRRLPPNVRARIEDDFQLVYPDIPVSSSRKEPTDELELVYPEDAAQAACASSSNPQTNVSQPTTSRKLAEKAIPLVVKSQPRHCRIPRCSETLPAHGSMDHCVQCSFDEWKQRRLSSINAHDMERRPSISSLMTTTSVEEKEIVAMLDDMSDVEEGPSSSNERTVNVIPGWDSDLTDLSSSDSDSDSMSDASTPDSDVELDGKPDATGFKIRIPLLITQLPSGSILQKCGNKRCNIALPTEYRWKTCDPCRRFQRVYQRVRSENLQRGVLGMEPLTPPDLPCQWRSLSLEMCEPETLLTPETSRQCSGCHKRIPLPEVYQWKTCVKCRAKHRRIARQKRDALLESRDAPDVVPHALAYQNRGVLLSSFEEQLRGFVEGQIMYYRAKLCEGDGDAPWRREGSPMMFVFAGEYSIVTGQRDGSATPSEADQEAMRRDALSAVAELERVLCATLSPGAVSTVDKGISMRYTCSLELIARLKPLATAGASSPQAVPLVKTFSGELEAVVISDESHSLFHGRRVVLRYRMVG